MDENWYVQRLARLKKKHERVNVLKDISERLQEDCSRQLESRITNRILNSPEIYQCVETHTGKEPIDLVSDILVMCMSNLSIKQGNFSDLMQNSLKHPRTAIRSLALKTILKELKREQSKTGREVTDLLPNDLVMQIFDNLDHQQTEVGWPVVEILSIVLLGRMHTPEMKNRVLHMLEFDDVVKCRVYDLAVRLAMKSAAELHHVEFVLDMALSELDNDDVLLQVNVLEVMVPLAEPHHGLIYLERRQVFDIISRRVEELEANPNNKLLVPGIMRFFGKIALVQPQKIIEGYPHMVRCLCESIKTHNISLLDPALDTLALLAHSQQGKLLLERHFEEEIHETLANLAEHFRNFPSDVKHRAFRSLELIFGTEGPATPEVSKLLHRWFQRFAGGSNMNMLKEFCMNPFPDIKLACLQFIFVICIYRWGKEMLRETAGFVEFLLDRSVEFDKDAKYIKYEIIQRLADSPLFDGTTSRKLVDYVNQGPYYVQTAMQVAIERQ